MALVEQAGDEVKSVFSMIKYLAKQVPLLLFFCLFSVASSAGMLDDFERDATASRETSWESGNSDSADSSDLNDDCDSIVDCILFAILKGISTELALAGESSMDRMRSMPRDEKLTPRQLGDSLLPILRFDTYLHQAFGNISAKALRVEMGYGSLAFQMRETVYRESNPTDYMTVRQIHALYRMSMGDGGVVMSFGLGSFELSGNETYETLSMTFPVQIQLSPDWSWEIKPNYANFNGSTVWDIEGGLLFTKQYFALNLGYRRLSSPARIIHGPYAGLSLFF